MRHHSYRRVSFVLLIAGMILSTTPSVVAQPAAPDAVRAGRYDNGKMWTFEYPPVDYLAEDSSTAWAQRPQTPGCPCRPTSSRTW